jgi:CrcB protein
VSGGLVLGFAFTLLTDRFSVAVWIRSGITVGFLGAYSTFSTPMLESFQLAQDGVPFRALGNLIGSVVLGMVALDEGVLLARVV